jgi:hypothetical protein
MKSRTEAITNPIMMPNPTRTARTKLQVAMLMKNTKVNATP